MSYISFYRKWRPQIFSEIIGQEYIVQTLQNAISKNRISHSYIFCGPKGTGKTSLARIFAKALNCVNGPTPDPCNKCANCTSIAAGINVDVIEIDAASNRGIDDIRELRDKVRYLPAELRKKVYIIDEAHQITTAASNAFLKILEEPPEHVVFIMATTEPHEVIPTIMSRCQRFDFEPIPIDKARKRIADISVNENINITGPAINLIAKHADGSLRDADGMLEQLSSFGDSKITVDDVTSLLGIIDQEMLFELTNILLEKNLNQALLFVQRIISGGLNLKIFVSEFIEYLYDLLVIKNYEKPMDILEINEDLKERYFNQAGLFSSDELEYFINLFAELLKQIRWGEGAKTFFKTAIIKAVRNEMLNSEDTAKRLKTKKTAESNTATSEIKQIEKNKPETKLSDIKQPAIVSEVLQINKSGASKSAKIEDIIHQNWERLLSDLRDRNKSIEAMFKETKSFSIEENKLIFYLDGNKKWHRDHLNKNNNTTLIQELVKSITGRNFHIVFELKNDHSKNIIKVGNLKKTENESAYKYLEDKFKLAKE